LFRKRLISHTSENIGEEPATFYLESSKTCGC